MIDLKRRGFIKTLGSATVVYAGTGAIAGCQTFSGQSDPYVAWAGPSESLKDPRVWALSFAILAPNPHNRQPWIVDLRQEGEIDLYIDRTRLLPVTDPFSRQIFIGTGAFLEVLRMAALEQGYEIQTKFFWSLRAQTTAEGFPFETPFAKISFVKNKSAQSDPLFKFILSRSTNRNPHDLTQSIPESVEQRLKLNQLEKQLVGFSSDKQKVSQMTDLSLRAMERELRTRSAYQESVDLFRIGESEIRKNPDGISLRGFMLETLNSFGLLDRKDLVDPNSSSFQKGVDKTMTPLKASGSFIWIISKGNELTDQIQAGRTYLRCQLAITELGLTAQPISQALQEYPEMKDLRQDAYQLMRASKDETIQMWARIGFAKKGTQSPRWPLKSFFKG